MTQNGKSVADPASFVDVMPEPVSPGGEPTDRIFADEISRPTDFAFDATTHQGKMDATLSKGTLSVVSGKLSKQSPEAVKVRTPASVLGVRGTEFLVKVD